MRWLTLPWSSPYLLAALDFRIVPRSPGVYVFTEDPGPLRPNPPLPAESDPDYEAAIERLRGTPCVLYVGKASDLSARLPGYRFRPYLEVVRRSGPPRHVTSPHKGRALLHAQQFFNAATYLRWAVDPWPAAAERELIRELRPVLNTYGLP
jgi:hypothetical protein